MGSSCPAIKAQMQMPKIGPGGEMAESETEECMIHTARKRHDICPPG